MLQLGALNATLTSPNAGLDGFGLAEGIQRMGSFFQNSLILPDKSPDRLLVFVADRSGLIQTPLCVGETPLVVVDFLDRVLHAIRQTSALNGRRF
jgi:hypothetical protein